MVRPPPLLESRPRMTRLRSALAVPLTALLVLAPILGASTLAAAVPAEGSVPSEVAAYVADGSLVAQLNDVYGVDAEGDGIAFDETTTTGVIERVHHFSDALREGEDTDHPLDIVNEWIVPISIAEKPVGLATVWINPASVRPELASFAADADLATALSAVPDGSSLVHDEVSAAWLALAADGTLTPLVPGTTGLSTPVPIDDIALLPPEGDTDSAAGDPATGVGFAIAVILLLLAIIIVALIVPSLRKKKPVDADGDAELAEPEAIEPKAIESKAIEPPGDRVEGRSSSKAVEPTAAAPKVAKPRKPKAVEPKAAARRRPPRPRLPSHGSPKPRSSNPRSSSPPSSSLLRRRSADPRICRSRVRRLCFTRP